MKNNLKQSLKLEDIETISNNWKVKGNLRLTPNAITVLKKRYLKKDNKLRVIESPREMFERVSKRIASADKKYNKSKKDVDELKKEFYEILSNLYFLPNSPTLMNAGLYLKQLSACFVIEIKDSIESIFDAVKLMARIHKTGGGTGFDFSNLRPEGSLVRGSMGTASGPVSFMKIFDTATEVMKMGGRRRGANMGVLRIDHPDIIKFINAKKDLKSFSNFNISVATTKEFWRAYQKKSHYWLIDPKTKNRAGKLNARKVFDMIVKNAWLSGDPGLLFLDEINKNNPTPTLGKIKATNPCGEVPLLPYESCNLGSINLAKFVKNKKIDYVKLKKVVGLAVHFLDNLIDVNNYLDKRIERITKGNRKIGLGVMGFADMLIQLEIPYDSEMALKTAKKVMGFIKRNAIKQSIKLAKARGAFPNFKKSILKNKYKTIRNATLTTIAPTGTISIIANASSGIEPLFGVCFYREVMEGAKLIEINKYFETYAKKQGIYCKRLIMDIAKGGSLKNIKGIPNKIKKIFKTALEIDPKKHVKMQAVFQKYTDNAVSKTINLPKKATKKDIKKIFLLAKKLKCKGITVYRYGSKKSQVLYIGKVRKKKYLTAHSEYSGGCVKSYCPH